MSRTLIALSLFLVTALALVACGGAAAPAAPGGNPHDMHGGAAMPTDGVPYDVQFIDGMIEHHEGAIRMAEVVLQESERPELLQMAEEIIAVQQVEIDQLREWRNAWYAEVPVSDVAHMDMGMMEIPQDERPFDLRFLEAMISHHEGAIHMAQMALEQAERPEIRAMAEEIIAVQQGEIDMMRQWYSDWTP